MQLLNANTQTWDAELLAEIGVTEGLFPPLVDAGTVLGALQTQKFPAYDLPQATFVTVASHDTASAIIGTPGEGQIGATSAAGLGHCWGSKPKYPMFPLPPLMKIIRTNGVPTTRFAF